MKILVFLGAFSMCLSCTSRHVPQEAAAPTEPQPLEQVQAAVEKPEIEQFVVTEEIYTKTFDEIEDFIRSLNQIIRNEDYDTWLTFLSDDYIRTTGDPSYLKAQSEKPLLKQSNIELTGLRDYFTQVVVPSRSQAELDEIEFLDEDHVKAISVVRGTRVVLYLLVRADGKWKIGLW